MKRIFLIYFFIISIVNAQSIKIKGYVYNSFNGNPVVNALVFTDNQNIIVTDNNGFFELFVRKTDTLFVAKESFRTDTIIISEFDSIFFIKLSPLFSIQTVRINASFYPKELKSDFISLNIKDFRMLPALAGEKDILKNFQKMPGIMPANEGMSDILIRGGSPDQTLYSIDGVPVFFLRHFAGFLSVFDENTINNIKLYKNYIPPEFGGRLSGVTDIVLKNGNFYKTVKNFSTGPFTSEFMIEFPLIKKKNSFIIAYRTSPIGYALKFITKYTLSDEKNFFMYYAINDFNIKFTNRIGKYTLISFSYYGGGDKMKFSFINSEKENSLFLQTQKNSLFITKLNSLIARKIYSDFRFAVNIANFNTSENIILDTLNYSSGFGSVIKNFIFINKNKISILKNLKFNFGLNFSYQFLSPIIIKKEFESQKKTFTKENNLFAELIFSDKKFFSKLGIRFSYSSLIDTNFIRPEPRFITGINFSDKTLLKAGIVINSQNLHFISGMYNDYPVDFWVMANKNFVPQNSTVYFASFSAYSKSIFIAFDVYYKNLKNLTALSTVGFWNAPVNWYDLLVSNGKGYAYGLELFVKKNKGKNKGWISINYSRSFRQFESFNNNIKYPYKYDRPLKIDLVYERFFSKKISFSAVWTYSSGLPYTKPLGYVTLYDNNYNFENIIIWENRNASRLKDYHRLDIAFNFVKKSKTHERNLSVGIINAYNRKNAYYYYIYVEKDSGANTNLWKIKYLTLFPFMPFVSYSVKF